MPQLTTMPKPISKHPWPSRRLRETLQFEVRDWARILNVGARTVERWEDEGVAPAGLPTEIFRGITTALEAGVAAADVRERIQWGLASFIHFGLSVHSTVPRK